MRSILNALSTWQVACLLAIAVPLGTSSLLAAPSNSYHANLSNEVVSFASAPSEAEAGSSATVVINYETDRTKDDFLIQVRLMDQNNKEVAQATEYPATSSGQQTVSVRVPTGSSGTEYQWHVQMFSGDWKTFLTQASGPTVSLSNGSAPSEGKGTVSFVTAPTTVDAGSSTQVEVRFDVDGAVNDFPLQVRLMDQDNKQVAQKTEYLNTSSGTQSLRVAIPADLAAGSGYEWHVQLFETDWSPIVAQAAGPGVSIGDIVNPPTNPRSFGECTTTDRDDPITECWDSESGYMNNFDLRRPMGDGYWSNWWVLGGWDGPVKARFGDVGDPTWIEWDNRNEQGNHYEFDLRIHKHSYYLEEGQPDYVGQDRGFPTRVSEIGNSLITTAEGRWTAGSEGRCHLSMTAWIYDGDDPNADVPRADVIIQTWDNSGELWAKYEREQIDTGGDGIKRYNNIVGTIESGDHTFVVLRILPGWKGESASYNLVDTTKTRPDPNVPFTTDPIEMEVDVRDIINELIILEQNPRPGLRPSPIASDWFLHGMEWNLAGQSGIWVTEEVKSSRGRFTFTDFNIPDIERGTNPGARSVEATTQKPEASATLIDGQLVSVFPNPFTDKIEYEYQIDEAAPTTVELYSLSGQKLRTIERTATQSPGRYRGSMDTRGLGAGTYILRVSSPEGYKFERVVKK